MDLGVLLFVGGSGVVGVNREREKEREGARARGRKERRGKREDKREERERGRGREIKRERKRSRTNEIAGNAECGIIISQIVRILGKFEPSDIFVFPDS